MTCITMLLFFSDNIFTASTDLGFFLCLKPLYGGWSKFFNSKKGSGFPIPHKVESVLSCTWYLLKACCHKKCAVQEFTPCLAFCSSEVANAPSPEHRGVRSCSLAQACFTACCLSAMQVQHTGCWRPSLKHVRVCKDYWFRVAPAQV